MRHKHTIKKLSLSVITLAVASYASASEVYVGGGLGYSALNTPEGNAFIVNADSGDTSYREDSSSSDMGGLGGTVFVGYNLNQTWALELGYTSYADSDYESQQSQYDSGDLEGTSSASLSYSTHSYDLFLKGNMPVTDQVSLFAKAGLSYVSQTVDYSNDGTTPSIAINSGSFAEPSLGSETYTAFRPAGGLGLHLNINDRVATEVFAQGFLGDGNFGSDSDAIASGYIVGASLIVNIV